jgi:4a-hydroxytetrahydrobiopterin dehydratase
MKKPIILKTAEIKDALKKLPGWKFARNKISKEFKFKDFVDSLGFVKKLAPYFESLNHHPDIHILYNQILFELQTNDVGKKVTDKDILMATKIEQRYKSR